jgi:peptidoglycan hydrolase-like protein with peptidoglycan-binding domain
LVSGWSFHAERGAADMGTAPYGGVDSPWGWALAETFRLNSRELGIQLIILGRRVWSCVHPDAGWRDYSGQWHGHMHVEFIPDAADNLTAAQIEAVVHGGSKAPSGSPVIRVTDPMTSGPRVGQLQRALNMLGEDLDVDDWYGPLTASAVGRFQERAGITVDEVYGPQTEAALNATLREQEGADELSWSERLPVPGWFEDQFPGNFEQGAATAQFYQTRAYGYARAVFEGLSQLKANQEAILAHQAGEDVVERVRQVLAENQEEVLAELSDGLASAVAAELGDRDPEAVEAAVTRALRRRDRRAAGEEGED